MFVSWRCDGVRISLLLLFTLGVAGMARASDWLDDRQIFPIVAYGVTFEETSGTVECGAWPLTQGTFQVLEDSGINTIVNLGSGIIPSSGFAGSATQLLLDSLAVYVSDPSHKLRLILNAESPNLDTYLKNNWDEANHHLVADSMAVLIDRAPDAVIGLNVWDEPHHIPRGNPKAPGWTEGCEVEDDCCYDEPGCPVNDDLADVASLVATLRNDALGRFDDLFVYVNLYASYWRCVRNSPPPACAPGFASGYAAYLDSCTAAFDPDLFSVDHYPFARLSSGEAIDDCLTYSAAQAPVVDGVKTDLFHTLQSLQDWSTDQDHPFWFIVQTSGRWGSPSPDCPLGTLEQNLREPTLEEIRMQVWSALAYGAKSIAYWVYSCYAPYSPGIGRAAWTSFVIEDEFNNPSAASHGPLYDGMTEVNRKLQIVGDFVTPLTAYATYHRQSDGGVVLPGAQIEVDSYLLSSPGREEPLVTALQSVGPVEDAAWGAVSHFRSVTDDRYFLVWNKDSSVSGSHTFRVQFDGLVSLSEMDTSIGRDPADPWNEAAVLEPYVDVTLAPGDAAFFRVDGQVELPTVTDYDGDGRADLAWLDEAGNWRVDLHSVGGLTGSSDVFAVLPPGRRARATPGDFDGDGMTDMAVKLDDGAWILDYAADGFGSLPDTLLAKGRAEDRPACADYDGDRITDLGVMTDAGVWRVDLSSDGFSSGAVDTTIVTVASGRFHPLPADYDGDGKADIAIKLDTGEWKADFAANGFGAWDSSASGLGGANARPFVGDFNGDGLPDPASWDDSGVFRFLDSGNAQNYSGYGSSASLPFTGDFDGDGADDIGLRDLVTGTWSIDLSGDGLGEVGLPGESFDLNISSSEDPDAVPVPRTADFDAPIWVQQGPGSTGSGTFDNPYSTIDQAVSDLVFGEPILVKASSSTSPLTVTESTRIAPVGGSAVMGGASP